MSVIQEPSSLPMVGKTTAKFRVLQSHPCFSYLKQAKIGCRRASLHTRHPRALRRDDAPDYLIAKGLLSTFADNVLRSSSVLR